MRWSIIAVAATLSAALGACTPAPQDRGQDDLDASIAPVSSAPRTFDALSKTAEAFTGGLEITEEKPGPNAAPRFKIVSALGHSWEIEFIAKAATTDKAGSTMWRTLMPNSSAVNIYAVNAETIKPGTANGGLCGVEKTAFLALAESESQAGDGGELQIAAFSGKSWPPTQDRDPPLCGTFGYIAHK